MGRLPHMVADGTKSDAKKCSGNCHARRHPGVLLDCSRASNAFSKLPIYQMTTIVWPLLYT